MTKIEGNWQCNKSYKIFIILIVSLQEKQITKYYGLPSKKPKWLYSKRPEKRCIVKCEAIYRQSVIKFHVAGS